jgi:hypothetical protein
MQNAKQNRVPDVSVADIRGAAGTLGEDEIDPHALASIMGQAFDAPPPRPKAFPTELVELCYYIAGRADCKAGMCLAHRSIALPFEFRDIVEVADGRSDDPPFIRDAHVDLVRAVATFFVREQAYWTASAHAYDADEREKHATSRESRTLPVAREAAPAETSGRDIEAEDTRNFVIETTKHLHSAILEAQLMRKEAERHGFVDTKSIDGLARRLRAALNALEGLGGDVEDLLEERAARRAKV